MRHSIAFRILAKPTESRVKTQVILTMAVIFFILVQVGEAQSQEGKRQLAITNAPLTSEVPSAVKISGHHEDEKFGTCSGISLTPRWILTSAHCLIGPGNGNQDEVHVAFVNAEGTNETVYSGQGKYYWHPDREPNESDDDLGLILLQPPGMSPFPGTTLIYGGTKKPWVAKGSMTNFVVVGWGGSTGPGAKIDCPPPGSTAGGKRLATDLKFERQGVKNKSVYASSSSQRLCEGDSGGPWLLRWEDTYMAFAIGSQIAVQSKKICSDVNFRLQVA